MNERNWYLGTADAVTQNIDIIEGYAPKYILILAGDHIYKQDYSLLLKQHAETGADVTVGCIEVPRSEASAFGVMAVDESDRILEFAEKPTDPPAMPGDETRSLASMGIYVFKTDFLIEILRADAESETSDHDFGKDIIPALVTQGNAFAHPFSRSCVTSSHEQKAYWRDVGTIDAFWQANIDLTDFEPELDLYDQSWPIWTYSELTAPAKFVHDEEDRRGMAVSSMIAGGCIISGAQLNRCLLHSGARVNSFSELNGVVALPNVQIGRGARLTNAIIDRSVQIPEGLVVGENAKEDAARFRRSENGICLITQDMIDQLNP